MEEMANMARVDRRMAGLGCREDGCRSEYGKPMARAVSRPGLGCGLWWRCEGRTPLLNSQKFLFQEHGPT